MNMLYGFAVLLIAVLAAIVFFRNRSAVKKASVAPPKHLSIVPKSASTAKSDRPAAPEITPVPDQFDPDATAVYARPAEAGGKTVAQSRDGATPVAAMNVSLVGLSGSQKGNKYAVAATGITIGRNQSCDIVLDDHRVSSRHAWVGIVAGKVILRDLESTNGTYLNANIHTSVGEVELRSEDTISFGGHQGDQFRFLAR
jgi:hypothetical protein